MAYHQKSCRTWLICPVSTERSHTKTDFRDAGLRDGWWGEPPSSKSASPVSRDYGVVRGEILYNVSLN